MKKIFPLLFSILFFLPAFAVKTINVNPVNLAVVIVEKSDSAKIQKEFAYYGYTNEGTKDGYTIMRSPNGIEICYSFQDNLPSEKFPTVVVTDEEDDKDLSQRLFDLNFKRKGNTYTKIATRDDNHLIQCTFGPSNTLILRCIKR